MNLNMDLLLCYNFKLKSFKLSLPFGPLDMCSGKGVLTLNDM